MAKCEVCGKSPAHYVCQRCRGLVCESCFDSLMQTCVACLNQASEGDKPVGAAVPNWFLRLFLVGFAATVTGVLLMLLSGIGEGSGALVILIGPVPVTLGYGPHASTLAAVALMLTAIGIMVMFFARRGR